MKVRRFIGTVSLAALLSACSGGGGGSISGGGGGGGGTTPAPTTGTCSLANRQAWAKAQLDEW